MERHRPYDLLARQVKPGDLVVLRADASLATQLNVNKSARYGSLSGVSIQRPYHRDLGIVIAVHHRSKEKIDLMPNEVVALSYVLLSYSVGWTYVADSVEEIIDVR